ncbi:MAG: HupE/UreJ family protein [Myxococcota bacterium]
MKPPGVAGRAALIALWLLLCIPTGSQAHTRSVSYSSWTFDEAGARVRLRIPLLELSRLAMDPVLDVGSGGRAAGYLASHLTLAMGGEPCRVDEPPRAERAPTGWAHFRWRVDCAASGAPVIESRILLREAPSHMHFARVAGEGEATLERVLIEADPRWTLASGDDPEAAGSEGTSLAGYVALGVEHILSGWDHLAFVLALLLLAGRLGEVAALVTSFTVAHSVTLGLAVLGLVRPEAVAVEALIGFSIALVAAENGWLLAGRGRGVPAAVCLGLLALAALAWGGVGSVSATTLLGLALFSACHFALLERVPRPARLRAAVAFAFGLVHGFGFAGVLAEMQLPTGRVVPALFGFNVGVELGQLAIVCAVWPLLHALERRSPLRWHRGVAEAGSAAILALGLYWFVERTLG